MSVKIYYFLSKLSHSKLILWIFIFCTLGTKGLKNTSLLSIRLTAATYIHAYIKDAVCCVLCRVVLWHCLPVLARACCAHHTGKDFETLTLLSFQIGKKRVEPAPLSLSLSLSPRPNLCLMRKHYEKQLSKLCTTLEYKLDENPKPGDRF